MAYKVKITSGGYSDTYINVKYSKNGIFYKKIKDCKYDYSSENYFLTNLYSHFNNAEELINRFDTFEKAENYNKEQKAKCNRLNKEIKQRRKQDNKERKDTYKKFG